MEILQKDFRDKFPEFQQVVDDASFFAIDTEFTGLAYDNSITPYDSPAEFYKKTKEASSGYIVVQFGITAFRVCPENANKFKYRTYNFYVYPRGRRQRFQCQGESFQFLASHNFDFNKLFRDGISCCDMVEATKLKTQFALKYGEQSGAVDPLPQHDEDQISVPEEEREALDKISDSIEAFLLSDENERVIGNCNAFQRKLIYQLVESKFGKTIFASSRKLPNSNAKVIVVERSKSSEEEMDILKAKIKQEKCDMDEYIGFTEFIRVISESKKLIIGHNMFLDILYAMRQFIGPLPDTLKEFKVATHKAFPSLLDTKYLSSLDDFKAKINSNVLSSLYESLSKPPFILPELEADSPEYACSVDDPKEHEAGYDSYLTGVAFIAMALHLDIEPMQINEKSNKLRPIINKLFIMRLADICYINLTGKELKPLRNYVFYVTFPEAWRQSDLVHHFRNFGGIYISWINSTSAFVALHNRENSSIVTKMIEKPAIFSIMPLADYKMGKKPPVNSDENLPKKSSLSGTETKTINHQQSPPPPAHEENKRKKTSHSFAINNEWS